MSLARRFLLLSILLALVSVPANAAAYIYVSHDYYLYGDDYVVSAWFYAWLSPYECQYYTSWLVQYEAYVELITEPGASEGYQSGYDDEYVSDGTSNEGVDPGSYYTVRWDADWYVPDCSGGVYYHDAGYGTDSDSIDSRPIPGSPNPSEGEPGDEGSMDIRGDQMGFEGTAVEVAPASGGCGISFGGVSSNNRYSLSVPYSISYSGSSDATCNIRVTNAYGASTASPEFDTRVYLPEIQQLSPSSAQKGTQGTLTIYGDHFYSESEVVTNCAMNLGSPTVQDKHTIQVSYSVFPSAPTGQCTVWVGNRKGWTGDVDNFTITQ